MNEADAVTTRWAALTLVLFTNSVNCTASAFAFGSDILEYVAIALALGCVFAGRQVTKRLR